MHRGWRGEEGREGGREGGKESDEEEREERVIHLGPSWGSNSQYMMARSSGAGVAAGDTVLIPVVT